ncbi:helix-turn-helix domain-containing protein [Microbacterium rhizosphaerae]|uniref:Helix-turn-helix domain-containing protein n=2 Tax=Microbacterium rhizosphaerae TaxID=1678237 RepID=A0ABZ0SPZ2_9MICO|nr:helix-turn-helix domain-containing protein [Microbacterium rhizosphaerae]WPR91436.1 helix-turn-helix domain-containing protein [Microbacterium rhizosphaerae]
MDVTEVARHLHVPVSTVYDWRTRGVAPRAYRFGKHLAFAVSDVRTWIEQHHEPELPARSDGS